MEMLVSGHSLASCARLLNMETKRLADLIAMAEQRGYKAWAK